MIAVPSPATLDRIVVSDPIALATTAAERMLARIDANRGRIAICLTGGSSPQQLYRLLATDRWSKRVPWDRTHWFISDERFVPPSDSRNNMAAARAIFLDRFAPKDHVHPIRTDAVDPEQAANLYEAELQAFYGAADLDPARPLFDLVLMGIGPDGHTASLFPGYPELDERKRWVVGVPQAHVEPFVPRVTLTLPPLASCREMLFEATGREKRSILAKLSQDESLPANRARSIGETVLLADQAAIGE